MGNDITTVGGLTSGLPLIGRPPPPGFDEHPYSGVEPERSLNFPCSPIAPAPDPLRPMGMPLRFREGLLRSTTLRRAQRRAFLRDSSTSLCLHRRSSAPHHDFRTGNGASSRRNGGCPTHPLTLP